MSGNSLRWYVMVDGAELYVACLNSYESTSEYRGEPLLPSCFDTEEAAESIVRAIYEYVGRLAVAG